MSTIGDQSNDLRGPSVQNFDLKMEVVVLPVSDVDRAKEFYEKLGWRLDADRIVGGDFRLVQFTPHGSACSIQFGTNLTSAAPGSAQALLLIVPDIDTARDELARRGIEISGVYHCATGTACRFKDGTGIFERVNGLAPDRASYSSFASFSDPDGKRSRAYGDGARQTREANRPCGSRLASLVCQIHGRRTERDRTSVVSVRSLLRCTGRYEQLTTRSAGTDG
jgi:catechol 2,3-dioxygenase-like lactoylglutathione lyase family enzyme